MQWATHPVVAKMDPPIGKRRYAYISMPKWPKPPFQDIIHAHSNTTIPTVHFSMQKGAYELVTSFMMKCRHGSYKDPQIYIYREQCSEYDGIHFS